MMKKDYYMILGIPRTESPSGIRTAFHELVKRYHPERVGWQGARFFQDIVNAYQALSGPEKRHLYDQGLSHAKGKMKYAVMSLLSIRGTGQYRTSPKYYRS